MAYTPPTYGESGEVYTDNVRNSLEHVRTAAEAAQAAADGNNASVAAASQAADQALEVAEAAKAFVESPTDSRVATLVQDSTSSTGAALSATFAAKSGDPNYHTVEAVRSRFARTNPPQWSLADDGLGALTSSGLTTTGGYIAATVGGTNGNAIFPLWGQSNDFRASFKVKATKSVAGSRSTVGFTVSPIGSLPVGTGATTAGTYSPGYVQGSGIAIVRDNISSTLIVVPDAELVDGAEYTVAVHVEAVLSKQEGHPSGTIAVRVWDSAGVEVALVATNYVHQYYVPRNVLIRTNVAAGSLTDVRIAAHALGGIDKHTAYEGATVALASETAFFHIPADPNGKVVYALHGHGATPYAAGWTTPEYADTWRKLNEAGYMVAIPRMGGNLWGNNTALFAVTGLHDMLVEHFDIERDGVYLWANSMGCTAACALITQGLLPVKAAYLAQPAIDLDALASNFSTIGDAYPDPAEMDAHNALKQPGSAYAGTPLMITASASDTTAVKANNADALAALASPHTLVRQITATGNHQDPSHYRADDTLRWFRSFG